MFALAERVLVLENGRIVADGTPHEALHAPEQESVAQLAGIENIFDAEVVALHPEAGTMTCRVAGTRLTLEAPLGRDAVAGRRVRLGLRAGDILLATVAPQSISARNIIPGEVRSLERRDYLVVAKVDCGAAFEVHLTPSAVESLHLGPGVPVWLVIKTHSIRLLR